MYEDDEIDPAVIDALNQIETRAIGSAKPPKPAIRDSVNDVPRHMMPTSNTTAQSASIGMGSNPATTHTASTITQQQTSLHFPSPERGKATSTPVPDIGLSPVRVQQHDEFGFTWDSDESDAFKAFDEGPNRAAGATAKASAGTHTVSPTKPNPANWNSLGATLMSSSNFAPLRGADPKVRSATSTGSSLEPHDSFSMDMDFDDDFLAQVEEAERQALAPTETSFASGPRYASNKGKARALSTQPGLSNSAIQPVSNSIRKRSDSDTGDSSACKEVSSYPPVSTQLPKRTRASPRPPLSTQPKPTKSHLSRDSAVILISSSDSEVGGACAEDQFESELTGIDGHQEDVIDISD
ncbi:hypothetical protein EDC04DRAFT_1913305 [Pisolithus marmoratus]|nr:hypothetical protein EDC04DRAFT_1913305 [Pisolithus marmoratus]